MLAFLANSAPCQSDGNATRHGTSQLRFLIPDAAASSRRERMTSRASASPRPAGTRKMRHAHSATKLIGPRAKGTCATSLGRRNGSRSSPVAAAAAPPPPPPITIRIRIRFRPPPVLPCPELLPFSLAFLLFARTSRYPRYGLCVRAQGRFDARKKRAMAIWQMMQRDGDGMDGGRVPMGGVA